MTWLDRRGGLGSSKCRSYCTSRIYSVWSSAESPGGRRGGGEFLRWHGPPAWPGTARCRWEPVGGWGDAAGSGRRGAPIRYLFHSLAFIIHFIHFIRGAVITLVLWSATNSGKEGMLQGISFYFEFRLPPPQLHCKQFFRHFMENTLSFVID